LVLFELSRELLIKQETKSRIVDTSKVPAIHQSQNHNHKFGITRDTMTAFLKAGDSTSRNRRSHACRPTMRATVRDRPNWRTDASYWRQRPGQQQLLSVTHHSGDMRTSAGVQLQQS